MSPARAVRSDVVRNRKRILAAAAVELAERGRAASLDEIAERAGLGAGTLHRHFATKDLLVEAVLVERLGALLERGTDLGRQGLEPGETLFRMLAVVTEEGSANHSLGEALEDPSALRAVEEAGRPLRELLAVMLEAAQAAGEVRSDLDAAELQALLAGAVSARRLLPVTADSKAVQVLVDGLRVRGDRPGQTPSPVCPP